MSRFTNLGRRSSNAEAELSRRIDSLELAVRQIPSRFKRGGGSSPFTVCSIIGGNTLDSLQPGILYDASVVSVPTLYDPDVDTSFIDGIGNAFLFTDNVMSANKVLIVNAGTTYGSPVAYPLVEGLIVYVTGTVTLTVDDDVTASQTVYVVGIL